MTTSRTFVRAGIAVVAACALTLAGCSKAADKDSDASSKSAEATTSASAKESTSASAKESTSAKATTTATATKTETETKAAAAATFTAENFHLHDGFVKAVPADKKMTAVFGVLENHTDTPAHLVGFSTSLDASMYQIHEVVDGKMQEKKGGIVIEPNSKHVLKPGGDHLMIMGLKQAVEAGSKITVTLKFEDGSTVKIADVPARALGAGEESYDGGEMKMDHGDMKMGDKDKKEEESK